ncbi:MFS transporter|uniref:Drug resistance transporter, EmrB/QacA subfamily n=1 Tax=Dendrosporobacter quercicolus TaxID=146817 RepID=A0A1G9T6L3_9FIRM|nr:MFS transporter [Dendrosporobacter quercicolus]NSL48519.1 MFS transporter [Dendrosporobacter quercicolus DSM 1736]SDM43276.1 drug resistance transporter, EmrB/QacA subfamily [Dendrosporobacter quercicolus]
MRQHLQSLSYYRWLVFGVAVTGTFMATLDSSIVNVALPVVAASLGAQLTTVQWVVSAYLLTISSLLPLFGRAGDMLGRRRVFTAGFLIFTLGSALCGLAFSIQLLIAARVLQAVGAAMIMANSQALVAGAFPGRNRGRALGMVGTVVALGSMAGPSLGGLLVGSLGWSAIFFINLPIGIIAFILGQFVLKDDDSRREEKFDFFGAFLFAVGMLSLLLLLSEGHTWGWRSQTSMIAAAISIVSLGWFIGYEQRISQPMIDLSLFRHRPFLAGNLAGLFSFMAMFCNNLLLPFYLTDILNLTPTQTGLLITPFPLLLAVVAPLSGYLSEKVSFKRLTVSGLTLTISALLYLSAIDAATPLWQIALCQAILGIGNGLFQSPNNNSVLSSVAPNQLGIAAGLNALVRNIGMVSGIAAAVSIFEGRRLNLLENLPAPTPDQLAAAFLSGYHAALLAGACFAAIAAIISLNRHSHVKPAANR